MLKAILKFYLYVTWESLLALGGPFRLHSLRLKEVRQEGENIKTFIFSPKKEATFEAGQYGLWFMPKWIWGKPFRFFTIAASPTEGTLRVSTRISNSDFKQKLAKLPIGGKFYMLGPIGRFTLGKQPPKIAVMVGGGIGVTPMRAVSRFVYDSKTPAKLILVDSANDYYLFRDEFEKYAAECHFVTRETLLSTLEAVVKEVPPHTPFYISGPPAFVFAAEENLKQLGVTHINKDAFLGY